MTDRAHLAVALVALLACASGAAPTAVDASCPTTSFLNLSGAPGAGSGYAAPTLRVSCAGGVMTIESNGITPYTFVARTPNPLVAHTMRVQIPLAPSRASQPASLPLLGTVGVAVNGLAIFGPNEAAQPANQAWGDPIYNGITDGCRGHTATMYHYHALMQKCLVASGLVAEPWKNPEPAATQRSPILAYALDGFPIYGRYECTTTACTTVVEMLSAWERIGDPRTNAWSAYQYVAKTDAVYLDRCNGHTGPGGDYHYHETAGFPYVIGCYAGTPAAQAQRGHM